MLEEKNIFPQDITVVKVNSQLSKSEITDSCILHSTDILFIKLNLSNTNGLRNFSKALIQLKNNSNLNKCLEIYRCNNIDINNSTGLQLKNSIIEEPYSIINLQKVKYINNDNNDKIFWVNITKLINERENDDSVLFAIRNNHVESLYFELGVKRNCVLLYHNKNNLFEYSEFRCFDLGQSGISYINLQNGHLYHKHSGIQTNLSKIPLSYNFIFGGNLKIKNDSVKNYYSEFYSNLLFYAFDENQLFHTLSTTGFKNKYTLLLNVKYQNNDYLDELGIKREHIDVDECPNSEVLYNYSDGSYIWVKEFNDYIAGEIIHYFKNGAKIEYYAHDVGIAYLKSITTSTGDIITYNYTNKILTSITNEYGERINCNYINGKLRELSNPASGDKISILYNSNERIETLNYLINGVTNSNYNENKTVFTYDETGDKITSIFDKLSGRKISFTYDEYKVVKVRVYQLIDNSEIIIDEVDFMYNDNFTSIIDCKENMVKYYFNQYGQCYLMTDNHNNIMSNNYDQLNENGKNGLIGKTKVQKIERNLLQNFSFEQDNIFSTEGWELTKGSLSKISTVNNGKDSKKSLLIDKDDQGEIIITQLRTTMPWWQPEFSLTGFLKCYKKDSSNILENDLLIKLSIEYYDKYNEDSSINESKKITEVWQSQDTYLNWKKFKLLAKVPDGCLPLSCKVEIELKGENCVVELDEMQLCNSMHQYNYNFVENGYFDFFDENGKPKYWTIQNCTADDKVITAETYDNHFEKMGTEVFKFMGTSLLQNGQVNSMTNITKVLSQTINVKGKKGEKLLLSVLGKGSFENDSNIFVKLHINYIDKVDDEYEFSFNENCEDWQLLTREIVASDSFSSVELTISSTSTRECYIDAIQLYKDTLGAQYSYTNINQINEYINEKGETTLISYDDDNRIQEITTENGQLLRFTYGNNKKIARVEDDLGNVINYLYDSKGNVRKIERTNAEGETLNEFYSYNQNTALLESKTDEAGNLVNYFYDNNETSNRHGLLTNIRLNNSINKKYTYDELLLNKVEISKNNSSYGHEISYNKKKEIDGFSNSKTNYNFTYDNLGNLEKIKYYGYDYCTLEYDKKTNNINHNLITKETMNDGTVYEYTYDSKDRLVEKSKNGTKIQELSYDDKNNIIGLKDNLDNKEYSYNYLSNNLIDKVTINEVGVINYDYDSLDQVQKSIYNFNEINKSFDFTHINETESLTPISYFHSLASEYKDEIIKYGYSCKGMYGAKPLSKNIQERVDEILKRNVYYFREDSQYIHYGLESFNSSTLAKNSKRNELDKNNKTFYMWVRPTGNYQNISLFSFQNEDSEFLSDLVVTSEGYLGYQPLASEVEFTTSNKLKLDQWNLVGIQFNDGNTARIFLNGEQTVYYAISEECEDITHLYVGCQCNIENEDESSSSSSSEQITSSIFGMPFSICLISGGSYNYSNFDLYKIYEAGNKCLNIERASRLSNGVSYYNSSKLKDFDVFTLNGSFKSNNGVEPINISTIYEHNDLIDSKGFEFDEELNKPVFYFGKNENGQSKSFLSYYLNLCQSNTISFRFKFVKEEFYTKPILSICSDENENILVYVDTYNRLRVKVDGNVSTQYFNVVSNKWYHCVLRTDNNNLYLSLGGFGTFLVSRPTESLTNNITYLGTDFTKNYSLQGYIEMLAVNKNTCISNIEVQELINTHKNIALKQEFDTFGRMKLKKLKSNNLTLTNTYAYKVLSVGNKYITSPLIEEEILFDGRKQQYEYDSYGNVSRKTLRSKENIILEDELYSYDESFRLIKVDYLSYQNGVLKDTLIYEYGYDVNGNISYINKYLNGNVVDEIYTAYQVIYKDRLHSFDGAWTGDNISLTYPTTDKFKPNKITKNGVAKTLQWDGNNLTRYGDYVYTYNSSGLRTSKQVNNVLTKYIYEGSKLIGLTRTENSENINMEFNYDQNNILIGFTIENNEYFYIRDILGNILGIIDQEGNVVVYYKYDVYGNLILKDVKIDNLASRYNPFIYKGYYYDVETQLYWVSSRYYSPELCRWISPDSIEYLDPQSINGLNLYAYAQNNPIMYYDPTGHSAESIWKIVGSVAIIAALGVLTIVSAGATSGLLAVAAPIISGAFWGATAGAITGGITGALNAYSSGGSILDGVADGMFSGTLSGAATGAISGAFSYLQFPTSFLNKIDPNIRFLPEMLNIGVQTLGNGVISMTSSLLSGNSIEAAKMAFLFGMAGGFMGANVAGQVAKSVWRSGLDSLGLSASEYLVTQWLGV